jgi:hypothetical protein
MKMATVSVFAKFVETIGAQLGVITTGTTPPANVVGVENTSAKQKGNTPTISLVNAPAVAPTFAKKKVTNMTPQRANV